jgi:hypothetical protein
MIAAADLGKISLGSVATTNNGTPFGVSADRIASISSAFGSGKISDRNLDDRRIQDPGRFRAALI